MTATLDMREADRAIVCGILRGHLPATVSAYVFGSRAHGGARRFSDLDLALSGGGSLDPALIGMLKEALSESDLPYRVDILDLALVDPAFAGRVMRDAIPLVF